MGDSFPVVLLRTDPEKRESVYRSLRAVKGVVSEPISLDGIPNFQYDTGVEISGFNKVVYEEVMKLDGVIDGKLKMVGPPQGLLQGTGILPPPPTEKPEEKLEMTQAETDAEFEEWARKHAEKDKRFR
ncbi:MAG TPA: hypothetical protein VJH90_00330 [archaeon]|nr:hypothetical protein [archaeon]